MIGNNIPSMPRTCGRRKKCTLKEPKASWKGWNTAKRELYKIRLDEKGRDQTMQSLRS